jgi:hypothetical protein
MKNPVKLAFIYSALSVLLGPGIIIMDTIYNRNTTPLFDVEPGTPAERYTVNHILISSLADIFAATAMIAIGVILLRAVNTAPKAGLARGLIAFMLCGYGLIVIWAGFSFWLASY